MSWPEICLKSALKGDFLPIPLFLAAVLLTLVFYSLERLQFLLWNWSYFQSQPLSEILLAFLQGLRFDLSAVAILAVIPFFSFWCWQMLDRSPLSRPKQRGLLGLYLVFQLPTMVLNLADAEFINFLGRRYTFDALFFFREIPGKFWRLLSFYWKLNLINLCLLTGFCFLCLWWLPRVVPARNWNLKKTGAWGFAVLASLVIALRGGLQSKPIGFAHAQVFAQPMMNSLVLNSSFTFLQTIKRKSLPRENYFSSEEMLKWVRFGPNGPSLLEGHRPEKPNIVLIILESFNLDYMGRPHGDQGYTPFLDELSKQSLFFPNGIANARRSIEGIGAIMGGIPALMNEPFVSSQYLTNYFLGVGTWLQRKNYHTSFFHGAQNTSMYFDQFMKSAGVQNYFGLNEYPDPSHSNSTWGIWDEPFLQWANQKISGFPQPFFTSIFTLSSHNPFDIPAEYTGKFPKGNLDIHESIGYADYSLRKFFESARQQPWFQNTIFILTADHTYKPGRPQYDNQLGTYQIPVLIYAPGFSLPKVDEGQIVQQIDLLPTILDLVGLEEKEKNYLGSSVFVPGDRAAVTYSDGHYLLVTRSHFLTHSRGGDFKMYSMQDPFEKEALSEPAEKKTELENRLKALIQYFSKGMWDNKLYYPSGR